MAKDPYRYFRIEARELLDEMSRAVLDLEKGGGAGEVLKLMRLAHTLKGAARIVKQVDIAENAHAIEDTLSPWRESAQAIPRSDLNLLLSRLDQMGEQLKALSSATQVLEAEQPGKMADEAWRSTRADAEELHAVLGGISESHVHLTALRRQLGMALHASELADLLSAQLTLRRGRTGARAGKGPDIEAVSEMADELRQTLSKLDAGLSQTIDQLDRELHQARETAEQLKLVPVKQLFTSMARTARDVAQELGKQVRFEGQGGDVRLDAEVLADIQPALVQLVRNAVAHGIESPAGRQGQGKPPEGQVCLAVRRQGHQVVFSCSDDGAGIDVDAVMQAARLQGRLGQNDAADTATLLRLLLQGGVSTASHLSAVSGRGVGLNVVNDALQRLGGDIALQTKHGQGTSWSMTLPLSMASIAVLEVEAGGMQIAMPLDAVKHTLRLSGKEIVSSAEGDVVVHEGRAMPFLALSNALQGRAVADQSSRMWSMVMMAVPHGLVAVGVDRLQGITNVVMRPLPDLAPAWPFVAGASLDVAGHPQLVLDPAGLLASIQTRPTSAPPLLAERAPVLVIDDSLTTRMLEQSILESAGYTVHTAMSAEEGLALARQHRYALFLVDVDMPGMDGFTFVQTTQAEATLRDVPAILVTSRNSPEDRQRGQAVGARDYIVKGEFAQRDFLDSVRRLTEPT